MVRKDLTVRERRKIYEDTICVVRQTQKIGEVSPAALKERSVRNIMEKQIDRCTSILTTVLGYHEELRDGQNGAKVTVLLPEDNDSEYVISKDVFDAVIVQSLPTNKELKEALWKGVVKRDKKAKARLDEIIG